jgi:hypothetical protein
LSNSSMQQMALSASIRAPASIQNSPVSLESAAEARTRAGRHRYLSFTTLAVKPAAEDALPTGDQVRQWRRRGGGTRGVDGARQEAVDVFQEL